MAEENAFSISKLCRFVLTSYTRTVAELNEKILKYCYIDVSLEKVNKRETTDVRILDKKVGHVLKITRYFSHVEVWPNLT